MTPPHFNEEVDNYTKWKRKFKLWQSVTDVNKAKQGGLLTLGFNQRIQEYILDVLSVIDISSEDGASKVIHQLDVNKTKQGGLLTLVLIKESVIDISSEDEASKVP